MVLYIFVKCISVLKFRSLGRDNFPPEILSFAAKDDGSGNELQMPTSELYKEFANSTASEDTNHIAFMYMNNIWQLLTNSYLRYVYFCLSYKHKSKEFTVQFAA